MKLGSLNLFLAHLQRIPPAITVFELFTGERRVYTDCIPRLVQVRQALRPRLWTPGSSGSRPPGPLALDHKHGLSLRFSGHFNEATEHVISSVLTQGV